MLKVTDRCGKINCQNIVLTNSGSILRGMDFSEFYLVVKNKEPIKTYPLVGESLDTILEYADMDS